MTTTTTKRKAPAKPKPTKGKPVKSGRPAPTFESVTEFARTVLLPELSQRDSFNIGRDVRAILAREFGPELPVVKSPRTGTTYSLLWVCQRAIGGKPLAKAGFEKVGRGEFRKKNV